VSGSRRGAEAQRPVDVISAELDHAEKQLGACIELIALYPNRERIVARCVVQRELWRAEVQRLANELEDMR
jgi:hypothetical protein